MLFEQGAPLTLRHPTPDPELHPIIQRVRTALGDDRAVPADHRGFALGGAAHEQLVGVGRATQRLGHPGDPRLSRRSLQWFVN